MSPAVYDAQTKAPTNNHLFSLSNLQLPRYFPIIPSGFTKTFSLTKHSLFLTFYCRILLSRNMASKSIYRPVLHQLSTASRIRSQHVHNSMRFRPDSLHVPTCSIKMMSSSARVSHLAYTNGYPIQSAKQSPATNAADTLLPGFSTVGIIIFPGAQETLRTLLQHIPPDLPHTAIQGVLLHYLKSWNLENQEPKMETITETQPVAKHEVASQKGLQNRVLDIIERSIDHKVGGYIGDEMDVQSKIYQDVVMELVRGGFVMPFGR